jgi:DNA polymerase-3 subunit delta
VRLNLNQLHGHLKRDLAPTYLVYGDEPLLVDEGCALIREVAQERGFNERNVMTVEPGFDWADRKSVV